MNQKDINHLQWVYERMQFVHNENPDSDYMKRFREILDKLLNPKITSSEPNWLSIQTMLAVKILWETENTNDENPRVKAVRMVQNEARQHGIKVDLKEGKEIIEKYIL